MTIGITRLPTEEMKIQPIAEFNADNFVAGAAVNGTGFSVQGFEHVTFLINVGDIVATGTVDAIVEESADDVTYAAVTGAAITQLTAAGGDGDQWLAINVDVRTLTVGSHYVRLTITVATADAELAAVALLFGPKDAPVTQPATVAEVVSV